MKKILSLAVSAAYAPPMDTIAFHNIVENSHRQELRQHINNFWKALEQPPLPQELMLFLPEIGSQTASKSHPEVLFIPKTSGSWELTIR